MDPSTFAAQALPTALAKSIKTPKPPESTKPTKTIKPTKPSYLKKGPSPAWTLAMSKVPKTQHVRSWDIPMDALHDIATGFLVTFPRALKVLANGRAFSPWGEEICESIGEALLHGHRDVKGSDGLSATGENISIKSLTTNGGVRFQMSAFIGAGRSCSIADLEYSIRDSQIHMVVDITNLSSLRVTALPAQLLLDWMAVGILTPSGFASSEEFELLSTATAASGASLLVDSQALSKILLDANRAQFEAWRATCPVRKPMFGP